MADCRLPIANCRFVVLNLDSRSAIANAVRETVVGKILIGNRKSQIVQSLDTLLTYLVND